MQYIPISIFDELFRWNRTFVRCSNAGQFLSSLEQCCGQNVFGLFQMTLQSIDFLILQKTNIIRYSAVHTLPICRHEPTCTSTCAFTIVIFSSIFSCSPASCSTDLNSLSFVMSRSTNCTCSLGEIFWCFGAFVFSIRSLKTINTMRERLSEWVKARLDWINHEHTYL